MRCPTCSGVVRTIAPPDGGPPAVEGEDGTFRFATDFALGPYAGIRCTTCAKGKAYPAGWIAYCRIVDGVLELLPRKAA